MAGSVLVALMSTSLSSKRPDAARQRNDAISQTCTRTKIPALGRGCICASLIEGLGCRFSSPLASPPSEQAAEAEHKTGKTSTGNGTWNKGHLNAIARKRNAPGEIVNVVSSAIRKRQGSVEGQQDGGERSPELSEVAG